MSDEEASQYPHSAISTWSGFVYQGKVALYHCLKLINEGDTEFQLQLVCRSVNSLTHIGYNRGPLINKNRSPLCPSPPPPSA